jgi:hypothetical protein
VQNVLLRDIQARLDENTHLLKSSNSYTESLAGALKLDWLRTLGSELKGLMGRILVMNFAIFRAVLEIRASLPSHLERSLIHEPFLLEDAIGRIAPVHMQFITSWEAFDSVLDVRFRNIPGHPKILSKEYILQDHATRRDISRDGPWEGTFLPGQRVDMSMLFDDTWEDSCMSCPRCQRDCDSPSQTEVQWSGDSPSYLQLQADESSQ